MTKSLTCVPDSVTLRCGVRATIEVQTSDAAQGVMIKARGYDSTVASLNPAEGNTNSDGYLEIAVTCAQERACPGKTTVTFAAPGYDADTLEIECETFPAPSAMEIPAQKMPQLLSERQQRVKKQLASVDVFDLLDLTAWYEGRKLAYAFATDVRPTEDCRCKTIDILMPKVELGVTPIGDVYHAQGLQLMAFLDSTASVAYISAADRQRAKELLQVSGNERKWLIRQGKKLSEFAIRPLSELNLAQPIQRDDGGILKGWTCRELPGEACVNIFYLQSQAFAFSMKLPDYGMVMCRPYPDAECQFFWHIFEYEIYKAADCAGPSVKETLTFALCHLS